MLKIHCKYDELVDLKNLKSHPKNFKPHPDDQIERFSKIIEYQGIRRPIRVSRLSGYITSGHGLMLALQKLKSTEAPVNYQDYESEDQEIQDLVADNALQTWSDLDLSLLNLELPNLGPDFDLEMFGLKDFVIEPADKYGDKDADATPEVRKTEIKLGDLFGLGHHRLLCGDSADVAQVERLMNGEKADMVYTDPPYGMNLAKSTGVISADIIGDDKQFNPSHILKFFEDVNEIFIFGADYFVELMNRKWPNLGAWMVWDKCQEVGLDTDWTGRPGSEFELLWSKQQHQRRIFRVIPRIGFFAKGDEVRCHPMQKPIKLHEMIFTNWGKDKTNIVDLYLGSGSTLIACEKTNRRCFGMEIDPQYCDVIIRRWEAFTGLKAEKIN